MTREEAIKILKRDNLNNITIRDGHEKLFDDRKEAFGMAIKVLEQTRWIPVSERLPEDHKNVLIYLSSNQITIGLYNSHRLPFMDKPIGWGSNTSHGWSSDEVVAWMPLPTKYEPQKSEDRG